MIAGARLVLWPTWLHVAQEGNEPLEEGACARAHFSRLPAPARCLQACCVLKKLVRSRLRRTSQGQIQERKKASPRAVLVPQSPKFRTRPADLNDSQRAVLSRRSAPS